jgi:hypothetical protein
MVASDVLSSKSDITHQSCSCRLHLIIEWYSVTECVEKLNVMDAYQRSVIAMTSTIIYVYLIRSLLSQEQRQIYFSVDNSFSSVQ